MTIPYLEPLPNESAKAYAAFCTYRDLGADRSTATAYGNVTGKVGRASKVWEDWSVKYHWVERAKLYDVYLDTLAREQREKRHIEELNEYHQQLANSSKAALSAGQKALKLAIQRLDSMSKSDISPMMLPAFIRAANDTIEKAIDGWGVALGIDELIELLGDDDSKV